MRHRTAVTELAVHLNPDVVGEISPELREHPDQVTSHQGLSEGEAMSEAGAEAIPTAQTISTIGPFSAAAGKAPRVVADFDTPVPRELPPRPVALPVDSPAGEWRRSWPFLASLALVGGLLGMGQIVWRKPATPVAPARPLGLFVDPAPSPWRISWNRDATVLHDAKTVRLFVQDGNDHGFSDNLPALSPGEVSKGETVFQVHSNDVTFRLEATATDGRVSAESFRVVQLAPPTPVAVRNAASRPPRAKNKVAPTVSDGIRSRIRGRIGLDVKVEVDADGNVVAARPARKPRNSLEKYLAGRAADAARSWKFEPAMQNGQPVPGDSTIRFAFGR